MKTKCNKCGRTCTMGVDATVDGCDQCTGVKRDKNGYAWEPGAKTQKYMDIATGKVFTKKRPKEAK